MVKGHWNTPIIDIVHSDYILRTLCSSHQLLLLNIASWGAYIIMLLVRCIKATERLWLKQTCNIANFVDCCIGYSHGKRILSSIFGSPPLENSKLHVFTIHIVKLTKLPKKGLLYCPLLPRAFININRTSLIIL